MELLITKRIENGTYKASITITNISLKEKEYISRIGEPFLNLGGTFTDGDVVFTTPDKFHLFFSDSPHNFSVDESQYTGDLKLLCLNWIDAILDRLTSIKEDINGLTDTFSGEEVTTI